MYFKFSFLSFITGLIMIFVIQLATFYRNLQIKTGKMDGDTSYTLLSSSLIVIPIILFSLSLILFQLHIKEKQKI
ncbi:hypothetical protein [Heyndrickxia ginsengihumi]|uniref:Uncharacterized protein n=1 Tax=Heyndrickxia ginsengihumi TaxID=363870 RepID=A0A6M0P8D7_9BACI|nr:hypothetical protein [Heyndrickxia ginsengihumi]MBE6185161.1 hypothetical protein [Bacillus sp. (in: firmicutes)]NEY20811.1 hypothetical protein [Heyndrickxia ginsengihumi]